MGDTGTDAASLIARHLDRAYLVETLMEPDDPQLVHYVQRVLRPELTRLGYYNLRDVPRNNLVVQLGRGEDDRALLIQNYTPAQHNNLMADPFSGAIANSA